jgi:hypothetical protein
LNTIRAVRAIVVCWFAAGGKAAGIASMVTRST